MKGVKTLGGEIFNIAISGLSERQILYLLWTAAALSVVTVFVIIKAGKAYKRRQEIVESRWRRWKGIALYEKYKNADFETLKNAEPRELIYGLALQVQAQVQNARIPMSCL